MNFLPKAAIFLILCGVSVFFLNLEEQRGTFASANRTYIDWLIGNSKQKIQEPSVTFLRIDEETFNIFESEGGKFGPVDFALMFDKLQEYSPKVTAVLPVLAFPDTDELLVSTVKNGAMKFETLLLGTVLEQNPTGKTVSDNMLTLLGQIDQVSGDVREIPEFTGTKSLPETQLRITSVLGFTEIDLAEETGAGMDSLIVPLLARHGEKVVPGFLLKAVILENDLSEADVVVELGREIRIGDKIKIPIDARGYLTVFSGLKERLPSFGADILLWDEESVATGSGIGAGLKAEERAALEKRVVLIGYDDEKARTIPFKGDEKISRAELFSLAVATIQSGRYIRKVASWMQYAVWAVIAVLGALVLRAKRGRAVMGSLVLLMAFFIAGMIQFQMNQSWMPLVIPMGLIACVFLCGLVLCQGKPKVVEEE